MSVRSSNETPLHQQLRESQLELIQRLAQAVDTRDTETGEHIQRIGRLSQQLALQIGWSEEDAEMLRHASAMHDIGKIGIPDHILLKPGKLDPGGVGGHQGTHDDRRADPRRLV